MELKVKLQKPVNKKQEKRKWKGKNAGNADDKLYTINFFPQLANGEIIKDRAGRHPPSLLFYLLHFKDKLRV